MLSHTHREDHARVAVVVAFGEGRAVLQEPLGLGEPCGGGHQRRKPKIRSDRKRLPANHSTQVSAAAAKMAGDAWTSHARGAGRGCVGCSLQYMACSPGHAPHCAADFVHPEWRGKHARRTTPGKQQQNNKRGGSAREMRHGEEAVPTISSCPPLAAESSGVNPQAFLQPCIEVLFPKKGQPAFGKTILKIVSTAAERVTRRVGEKEGK